MIALATPYALNAVTEAERADIERRVAAAPQEVAQAFADEVRAVRETMAVVSAATAVEPPDQLLIEVVTITEEDRLDKDGKPIPDPRNPTKSLTEFRAFSLPVQPVPAGFSSPATLPSDEVT